jgi:hypothetical protein
MSCRAVVKMVLIATTTPLVLSGCQSGAMSCESYQEAYDGQIERFAFMRPWWRGLRRATQPRIIPTTPGPWSPASHSWRLPRKWLTRRQQMAAT